MAASFEGEVDIPLEEFWEFVAKFHDKFSGEVAYGVPKFHKNTGYLTISFAVGSEGHPSEWAKKPAAVTEWEALK
jgi:hypothetical protein